MTGREEVTLAARLRETFENAGYSHPLRFVYPRAHASLLRRLPDRANWRLELGDQSFYLKCHRPRRFGPPPGIVEWMNHELLLELNIPVPTPAAAGQETGGCSFFCSVALPDAVPLDEWLSDANHRDRRVVERVADMVRRLHGIPLTHRDLYLCHVFITRQTKQLYLVDLQRLKGQPGRRLRRRWFVKDLAALFHSSRVPGVTRTDRLRFLKRYLRKERVDAECRRWMAAVLAKAEKIARHRPRFDGAGRPRA